MNDTDDLGRLVREVWVSCAREHPDPKPSWLVPWEGLGEWDKGVDRRIGEAVAAGERERIAAELDRLADDFPPDRRTAFRAAAEVVRKGAQTQDRSNDKEAGHGG